MRSSPRNGGAAIKDKQFGETGAAPEPHHAERRAKVYLREIETASNVNRCCMILTIGGGSRTIAPSGDHIRRFVEIGLKVKN
jgi:hypothetical protein